MMCSVYIATSIDGYIATDEGNIDWLHTSGDQNIDINQNSDMGFNEFISSIDCIVMGRKCMEMISSFNLTPDQWPYGNTKIYALSNSMKQAPENVRDKVEMYSGDIQELVDKLENDGYKHAYIDGGMTITSFLNKKLINKIIITKAPIILGRGIPLFGKLDKSIILANSKATILPNNFIQVEYSVNYL